MNTVEEGIEWLNEQLRLAGIDRAELARRGNFNPATLTNVYSGKRKVGAKLARGIAAGLGMSQDIVFRKFGVRDEDDNEANNEDARLFSKLLDDIEDDEEKRKAVGLVTAVLRQIAITTRQSKSQSRDKAPRGRSKTA